MEDPLDLGKKGRKDIIQDHPFRDRSRLMFGCYILFVALRFIYFRFDIQFPSSNLIPSHLKLQP